MAKRLNVQQGTEEWKEARTNHWCASEAPIMMGVSSKCARAEFVRLKATGDVRQYSEWVQRNLLGKGHEIEAAARSIAEEIIGDDLYTEVVAEGGMLASLDGITLDGEVVWECKSWNDDKAACIARGVVHDDDDWQIQQQLVVSGASRCLYMVTDGTPEKTECLWVEPRQNSLEKLQSGWRLFGEDVRLYREREHVSEADYIPAEPTKDLPAVFAEVSGAVSVKSNLDIFRSQLMAYVDAMDAAPTTETGFAALKDGAKKLKEAEDRIKAAVDSALAQTASIDEMRRAANQCLEICRANRLAWEKIGEKRRQELRTQMIRETTTAYCEHWRSLDQLTGGYMPTLQTPDFSQAIYRKHDLDIMRQALYDMLAKCKLEANAISDGIKRNLVEYDRLAGEFKFLFGDLKALLQKPADDFVAAVKLRISEHKETQAKREAEERERIRQEELAKIKAEEEAKASPIQIPSEVATPVFAPASNSHKVQSHQTDLLDRAAEFVRDQTELLDRAAEFVRELSCAKPGRADLAKWISDYDELAASGGDAKGIEATTIHDVGRKVIPV